MFSEEQARFLYQLLDQVSVKGEDNKAMIVEIMRVLRQMLDNSAPALQNDDGDAVEVAGD